MKDSRQHDGETGLPLDGPYSAAGGAAPDTHPLDDSSENEGAPVSGPFAGIDRDAPPAIVDAQGQRMQELDTHPDIANGDLVDALEQLSTTHHVTIERGAGAKPTHRIILGEDPAEFREQLARSLDAALLHHSTKAE